MLDKDIKMEKFHLFVIIAVCLSLTTSIDCTDGDKLLIANDSSENNSNESAIDNPLNKSSTEYIDNHKIEEDIENQRAKKSPHISVRIFIFNICACSVTFNYIFASFLCVSCFRTLDAL